MTRGEYKIAQKTSVFRLLKDKMADSVMFTFTMLSVLLVANGDTFMFSV